MNKPVGGRGKKAPYEQTHVRIPLPIKDRVENLKQMYLDGSLEHYEEILVRDAKLAREYENLLTGSKGKVNSEENPLPSLRNALQEAKRLLKQKKSAKETVAKLLTALYATNISVEDLKDN
jgi:dTDP-4-amino-4,6-dideoxygalactose transaminase